jgi:hypothetical protein
MEVYIGSTCTNMYYVACEDDNNNGNGSTKPVISLQGNAGETVFVRIWGYGGATGSFNICVLDYYTPNIASYDLDILPDEGTTLEPGQNVATNNTVLHSEEVSNVLHVTPNPASDRVKVSFLQTETCKVSAIALADYSGKRVLSKTYDSTNGVEFTDEIEIVNLPDGIYVLQMMTSCGLQTEKVVIAH